MSYYTMEPLFSGGGTLGTKASVIINQQIKNSSFILPWNLLQLLGTLSNRRRRPHDGNQKHDISFEMSLRMYSTL